MPLPNNFINIYYMPFIKIKIPKVGLKIPKVGLKIPKGGPAK
jgi:hypothetical protein